MSAPHPARADLLAAELADIPADRFRYAHRAALRATSVVLSARAPRRIGRRNAWQLVAAVAPELAEWAGFFLSTQARCEAIEAGVRAAVSQRDADDMLRDAERFCAVVEQWYARRASPVLRASAGSSPGLRASASETRRS